MATQPRKSYLDGDIEAAIESMALDGWTPAQISKELHRQERFLGRVPEDRTIQRRVSALQARDKSGAWSVADATTRDAGRSRSPRLCGRGRGSNRFNPHVCIVQQWLCAM